MPRKDKAAEAFGERLKSVMRTEGLGTADLAEKLGRERSEIAKYYHGNKLPDKQLIRDMADIMGVAVMRLDPSMGGGAGGDAAGKAGRKPGKSEAKAVQLDQVTLTATVDIGPALERNLRNRY